MEPASVDESGRASSNNSRHYRRTLRVHGSSCSSQNATLMRLRTRGSNYSRLTNYALGPYPNVFRAIPNTNAAMLGSNSSPCIPVGRGSLM